MKVSFVIGNMYKHLYKDKNMAFVVKQVLQKDKNETVLFVDWYQKTEYDKYITIGISGEYTIYKNENVYYIKV